MRNQPDPQQQHSGDGTQRRLRAVIISLSSIVRVFLYRFWVKSLCRAEEQENSQGQSELEPGETVPNPINRPQFLLLVRHFRPDLVESGWQDRRVYRPPTGRRPDT